MTARSEVLRAAHALTLHSPDGTFSPDEVVEYLQRSGTTYKVSTIRTHVVAVMCANAPRNHGVTYMDLERVSPGRYRLRDAGGFRDPSSLGLAETTPPMNEMKSELDLALVAELLEILQSQPLTQRVAEMEFQLAGKTRDELAELPGVELLSEQAARTAMHVRAALGRVNDLIHASVICAALPRILLPGERISVRPSLASGNDSTRPYDLETTHRIAEFKVSIWQGRDTMRQRMLFGDLVSLAMDERPLLKDMYVVGGRQARFLRNSTSTAQWMLQRSGLNLRTRFLARYGEEPMTVAEFTRRHAADVRIIDLCDVLPGVFGEEPTPGA